AATGPAFDETAQLELPVDLCSRVRIDVELGRKLTDRRQLCAAVELARLDGRGDLRDHLLVDRDAGVRVDLEFHRALQSAETTPFTVGSIVLVQYARTVVQSRRPANRIALSRTPD